MSRVEAIIWGILAVAFVIRTIYFYVRFQDERPGDFKKYFITTAILLAIAIACVYIFPSNANQEAPQQQINQQSELQYQFDQTQQQIKPAEQAYAAQLEAQRKAAQQEAQNQAAQAVAEQVAQAEAEAGQ